MTLSRKLASLIVEKNVKLEDIIKQLESYKLLSLLPSIKEAVKKMAKDEGARDTVHIESPFNLSSDSIARIKRIVGNDLAPHEITLNPALLVGFKARFKGKLYDGSAERIIKAFTSNQ